MASIGAIWGEIWNVAIWDTSIWSQTAVEPVPDEPYVGGFWFGFGRELERRKRARREQLEREEEVERIEDATTRQIAELLRKQEAEDARRAELDRLSRLVQRYQERPEPLPERVEKAIAKAMARESVWALMALDRELRRAKEEEDFLLQAAWLMLND